MALPIKWSLPSLSEITSPFAGFPKTLSTSLENTQSCPCKIRARGLTTIPAIRNSNSEGQPAFLQHGSCPAHALGFTLNTASSEFSKTFERVAGHIAVNPLV